MVTALQQPIREEMAGKPVQSDADKIDTLIMAANRARAAAMAGKLYASWQGMALFNAMHDLTGCDELYDVAKDIGPGQAMAAIIAKIPFQEHPEDWSPYDKTAIGAYDYADAMLAARKSNSDLIEADLEGEGK